MQVAVVKYNAGNVQSLGFALAKLGVDWKVTDDPDELQQAEKVIFPGQGEASSAMTYLKAKGLDKVLKSLHQPFLGICLGMQLMCERSEENNSEGLGIIPATVRKFTGPIKVPHMGWNDVFVNKGKIMNGVKEGSFLYFVHSYYVEHCEYTISSCNYGVDFSVAVQKDNYYAIQPHPEKSAEVGHQILSNFLSL